MSKKGRILTGVIIAAGLAFVCGVFLFQDTKESVVQATANVVAEEYEIAEPIPTVAPTVTPTVTPRPTATPIPVASTEVKVGKTLKTIYEVKGKFTKQKQKLVYKKANGKLFRGGFFLKGKYVYFARKTGEIARGWLSYRGNYYYLTRLKGRLTSKKQVEGVKLGKYGIAKKGALNQKRAATYVRAAATLKKITKASDTKATKLYKCYQWVMKYGYVRHRTMKEMMKQANWKETWDIVFANDIFEKHSGCCVSDAAAFALLAKECGYKKVTLCCDTGHSWDDIGGRLYDPLFAKCRSYEKNYNARYSDYRINPAITKKIS